MRFPSGDFLDSGPRQCSLDARRERKPESQEVIKNKEFKQVGEKYGARDNLRMVQAIEC
jgi:hypothetical protein